MKKPALLAAALLGLSTAAACSTTRTMPLMVSDASPAADGQVKVKPEGTNTAVTVDVKHLAPPFRLEPGATSYVVWAQPLSAGASPQNIGTLSVDDNRQGKLRTLTPFRSFDLFVTAESTPVATEPSGERVLFTRITDRG